MNNGSLFVMAIDPGKTSGWAQLTVLDGVPMGFATHEYDFESICSQTLGAIDYWNAWLDTTERVVVCESFLITGQTAKNTQAPWSLEVIGIMRYFARRINADFVLQRPSDAKSLISDKILKDNEYWKVAKPHARDATRHLLYYLTTKRNLLTRIFNENSGLA